MNRIVIPVILLTALIFGCATTKNWSATGGSRSDGVIRLSYEYGELEAPVLNEQQGTDIAIKRCNAWGYSAAEAFGGTTRVCNQFGGIGGGCARFLVTKEFQCTNASSDTTSATTTTNASPVRLGIQNIPVTRQLSDTLKMGSARGAYVVAVIPGSVAEKAGVQQGDVILRVGDQSIMSPDDMQMSLSKVLPKSKLPLTIWRNGAELVLFAMF